MRLTQGTLLGGRVRYAQPETGFRNGIEPVLLAASVDARPGQRVLEAGTGAGAGLLCLAARVGGLLCTGVERDPGLAELALANAAANDAVMEVLAVDLAGAVLSGFDHAMANPPWHGETSSASPVAARDLAKRGRPGLIGVWAGLLAAAVRPGGTLTLIVPAVATAETFSALATAGCGGLTLAPLWPKAGRAAKIVVLRGTRGSRAPDRVTPGLVLHDASGAYTDTADSILRAGAAWLLA